MIWQQVKKSNPRGVELANRHYSRIRFGKQGKMLGPPGRLLCLLTPDENAVWVSHWPYAHLALDGVNAYRCTMFRNEGPQLSSGLILAAMEATESYWADNPPPQWITWVAPDLVQSRNPGFCFRQAGWHRDRDWRGSRKDIRLWRFSRGLLCQ